MPHIGYTIGDHLKGTVHLKLECKYIFKLSNVQPNLNCWNTNKVWRTPQLFSFSCLGEIIVCAFALFARFPFFCHLALLPFCPFVLLLFLPFLPLCYLVANFLRIVSAFTVFLLPPSDLLHQKLVQHCFIANVPLYQSTAYWWILVENEEVAPLGARTLPTTWY